MYYEIIISKNGHFLFATDKRSCTNEYTMHVVYKELCKNFKKKDGYEISVVKWESCGHNITEEELNLYKGE